MAQMGLVLRCGVGYFLRDPIGQQIGENTDQLPYEP